MAYQKYKDNPYRREPQGGRDHIQHIEKGLIGVVDTVADVPPRIEALESGLPGMVADAIAADDTVRDAAAAAVTTEIAGRDLVESTDPRLPSHELLTEDILATTTDDQGRMTDLTVRASDGQFAEFVIERLSARLAGRIGGAGPGDYYVRGDEVLPVLADTSTLAGWGSSSMFGIADALAPHLSPHGITYVNGGKGGEMSFQTAARQGALPALLTFPDNTIPASGAATVTASNLQDVNQATSTVVTNDLNLKAYAGTVAGVHGTLAYNATTTTLEFTRTTAGDAVPVDPDTPLIPDLGEANRRSMSLIWAGKNDLYGVIGTVDAIVGRIDAMFDWLAPLYPRTLVLGHFNNEGTPADSIRRERIDAANAAHAARYGDLFLDVAGFLASPEVWTITGITPTTADLDAQAANELPPSLGVGGNHLNATGYGVVAGLIHDRMTSLGWL